MSNWRSGSVYGGQLPLAPGRMQQGPRTAEHRSHHFCYVSVMSCSFFDFASQLVHDVLFLVMVCVHGFSIFHFCLESKRLMRVPPPTWISVDGSFENVSSHPDGNPAACGTMVVWFPKSRNPGIQQLDISWCPLNSNKQNKNLQTTGTENQQKMSFPEEQIK